MKKTGILAAAILTLTLYSCGDSCYKCRLESYWNGISYTDRGQYAKYCQDEGESDEDYEARIAEKVDGTNWSCVKD